MHYRMKLSFSKEDIIGLESLKVLSLKNDWIWKIIQCMRNLDFEQEIQNLNQCARANQQCYLLNVTQNMYIYAHYLEDNTESDGHSLSGNKVLLL